MFILFCFGEKKAFKSISDVVDYFSDYVFFDDIWLETLYVNLSLLDCSSVYRITYDDFIVASIYKID